MRALARALAGEDRGLEGRDPRKQDRRSALKTQPTATRESNRVYALAPAAPERDEYAPAARREKDARTALVGALGRSRAQTLASDVARPAPLVSELAEVRREQDELDRIRRDASDELRLLERERPAWYRSRARAENVPARSAARRRP